MFGRGARHRVKAQLAEWLAPRGLVFNEDKTRITFLEDQGVDFLGFTIRRFRNGKPLTKPSDDAFRRIRKRLSTEVKALRGANAAAAGPKEQLGTEVVSRPSSCVCRRCPDRCADVGQVSCLLAPVAQPGWLKWHNLAEMMGRA